MSRPTTYDATSGQRATIIAGLLGLIPALAVTVFRIFAGDPPAIREELLGNLAFALALASPCLIALAVSQSPNLAVRGVV